MQTEVVRLQDGDGVAPRPCPPWCALGRHFAPDVIYADDGYHHYGPEVAVPTSYKVLEHGPETVVKVTLKSWTHPVGAVAGPARIELQLGTADENTRRDAKITPGSSPGSRRGSDRSLRHL